MTANYSILFTIEILHEYFVNRKCEELEIVPAEDCKELLRKMNIQWRFTGNRLIALIKENDAHEPFVNISLQKFYHKYYDKTVFRFYVKIKNPLFLNFTNIDHSYSSGEKFYFSNLANNNQNGILNLTSPVRDYAAATMYLPGSLVKDPANGNIFESITKHTSKKKNPLSDPLVWAPKGLLHQSKPIEEHALSKTYAPGDLAIKPGTSKVFETITKHVSRSDAELDDQSIWVSRENGQLQYVTDNDKVGCCGNEYIFKMSSPVTKADITIFGFNYNNAAPAYNLPIGKNAVRNFKEPATQVAVNLSALRPGKYDIKINKETKTVYFDPSITAGNILGVIEIFNHLPGTDNYSLLDNDEKIKNRKYTIQFANRRVVWRFKPKDGKAQSITDTGHTGYVFKLNGDVFVSAIPIPLSESVVKTLKLDFHTKDFSLFPLPNPGYQYLAKCTQNDYDYLCSDILLNY